MTSWWSSRTALTHALAAPPRAKRRSANTLLCALMLVLVAVVVLSYGRVLQRAIAVRRGAVHSAEPRREDQVPVKLVHSVERQGGDVVRAAVAVSNDQNWSDPALPYALWALRTWLIDDEDGGGDNNATRDAASSTDRHKATDEREMARFSLIEPARSQPRRAQVASVGVSGRAASLTRFRSIAVALNRTTGHRRMTWPLYEKKLGRELSQWFTSQISPQASKLLRSRRWSWNPKSEVLLAQSGREDTAMEEFAALHHAVHWSLLKRNEPQLVYVHAAVTPWVCGELMRLGNLSLARSTVVLDASEVKKGHPGKVVDPVRTSYGTFLTSFADRTHPANVAYRVAAAYLLGVPESHLEPTQILKYTVGQEYRPHLDYFDSTDEDEMRRGGQRAATMLMWLNDNVEGGETSFPAGAISLAPRRGDAVIFYNVLDGEGMPTDRTAVHAGLPPLSGEKWVAVVWAHPRVYETSTLG